MHYETLQLPKTATVEEIKRQYRKLSLVSHPDRKGGDAIKFQRLTAAYEALKDEHARHRYDVRVPKDKDDTISVEITLEQAYAGCAVPFELHGETCYVEIPAGIDNHEIIHVARSSGSIRVKILVRNTTCLVRSGLDLLYTHTLTLKDALCGAIFDIEYMGQTLRLSTQGTIISPTYRKVIPLKGMKRDKNCGSLTIMFKIEFPKLTREQLNAIEQIL